MKVTRQPIILPEVTITMTGQEASILTSFFGGISSIDMYKLWGYSDPAGSPAEQVQTMRDFLRAMEEN
jgi:hypothetical protein